MVALGATAGCTGTASTVATGGSPGSTAAPGTTGGTSVPTPSTVSTTAPPTTRPVDPGRGSTVVPAPTTTAPVGDLAGALEGRTFESQSVQEKGAVRPLVPGTKLTLDFRSAQLGASAGCNSMGGSYELVGDVLHVVGLGTTDMACLPAERMQQDDWFAKAIIGSPHLRLDGSTLVLETSEVTIVFVDRKVADPDRPLVGSHWVADTVIDGAAASSMPVGATAPSVDFAADGTFGGFSGCAPLTGRYTIEGARLVLADVIVANAAACTREGEHLDQVTRGVLKGSVTFEIDGPRLRLTNNDVGLRFVVAA